MFWSKFITKERLLKRGYNNERYNTTVFEKGRLRIYELSKVYLIDPNDSTGHFIKEIKTIKQLKQLEICLQ